ncbi:MAG: hypothetical protein ABI678_24670, partial [Kofleriaceae bacterium]
MIGLLASLVCIAQTDVCAPDASKVEGTIGQSGGEVVITPSAPMTALGARFRAGTKVVVDVLPWGSSDGHRGAIVHVGGERDRESVIAGVRVAGAVRVGQLQGRAGHPQLVQATDLKSGHLTLAAGTIDVGPGMRLDGSVDLAGVRLQITSPTPVHALGLELGPGTVAIEQRDTGYTIRGTLTRPQEVAGVLVDHGVAATIEGGVPRFDDATFARDTQLHALGLPDGTAPAGTRVVMDVTGARLYGPIIVCGVALAPSVLLPGQPAAVLFTKSFPPPGVVVAATLAGTDIDLGNGVRMSGPVLLGFDATGCHRTRLEGTLSRPSEQLHLHFATRTKLALFDQAGQQTARGTLARPEVVEGLALTGAVTIGVTGGTTVELDGTLAKGARFEAWDLPAGTQIEHSTTGWSFTVPRGTAARAIAEHRGHRIDDVLDARLDAATATISLRGPTVLKGTTLALASFQID